MPARVLLLSPVLDLSAESARNRDAINPDPFNSPNLIDRGNRAYVGDASLTDPRLNLLGTNMSGWPPILVQTGGLECIADEAESLGTAMRAAGTRCEVQIWPGQVHGFHAWGFKKVPEALAAVEYSSQFLAST